MKSNSEFKILTAGYGLHVINILWEPIKRRSNFSFCHLLHPSYFRNDILEEQNYLNLYCVREKPNLILPYPNIEFLSGLETDGVPTIHNMIMGDSFLCSIPYSEALAYASFVGLQMEKLFLELKPSLIVSGFDGFHSSMSLAIAKKIKIPWFALSFSVLPKGLTGFSTTTDNSKTFSALEISKSNLKILAEKTLSDFETYILEAPTIKTENNIKSIIEKVPNRVSNLLISVKNYLNFKHDKYTRRSISQSFLDYFRRKVNLIFLQGRTMLMNPPNTPFMFIGLHMQPEMAIDVWAPFFSNQFNVIESIARSAPPSHKLLVKVHKIDADNYSLFQFNRLKNFPNVEIVSPYASSRLFIEKAALVFSIQGTITLEAAMLGKQVLVFGETLYNDFSNVTKVGRITDLPSQIRSKLLENTLDRDSILAGLESVLSRFAPGCYNDWNQSPTDFNLKSLVKHFEALRSYIEDR